MERTSKRRWIGFALFGLAVVAVSLAAFGWLLQAFVIRSCAC